MEIVTPASQAFSALRSALEAQDVKDARRLMTQLARQPKSETGWVEWKQANKLDSGGRALHSDDKRNFAKCLSAFANTAGGLVIWGMTNEGKLKPFEHFEEHLRVQMNLVVSATLPPISGVDPVAIPAKGNPKKGYVVTYVPRSEGAPHQVSLSVEGKGLYYGRFGSECKSLDHFAISDLLGRRPGAVFAFIEHMSVKWMWVSQGARPDDGHHKFDFEIIIDAANHGAATAHNVFGTVEWPHNKTSSWEIEGVTFSTSWSLACKGKLHDPTHNEQRSINSEAHSFSLQTPLLAGHMLDGLITLRLRARCPALPADKLKKAWLVRALSDLVVPTQGAYMISADGTRAVAGRSCWSTDLLSRAFPEKAT